MQRKPKINHTLLFFLAFSLLAVFPLDSQTITGHIDVRSTGDTGIVREHVIVWLKLPDGQWRITSLDKNFDFSYNTKEDPLKPDTTEIRITAIGLYKDTIVSNVIISNSKPTRLIIPYPPFCVYDKSKNDSVCPICNKQDSVIKLIYDDYYKNPSGPRKKKAKKEYQVQHRFKYGCDPTWYCRRDKHDF